MLGNMYTIPRLPTEMRMYSTGRCHKQTEKLLLKLQTLLIYVRHDQYESNVFALGQHQWWSLL